MRLIDTHCHLVDDRYSEDRDIVIQRAFKDGIGMLNCAIDYLTSCESVDLVKRNTNLGVFTSVGLHPQEIDNSKFDITLFDNLIEKNSTVISAVGEIGLDYFRHSNFDEQKRIFSSQLDLAVKHNLPVIIHCRDADGNTHGAYQDLITILESKTIPRGGVVHSFGGTLEVALRLVSLGYFLGINGIVTFDKTGRLSQIIKEIDPSCFLLETDSPYLTPVPFRGQRNEPAFVHYVCSYFSEILGCTYDELASISTQNANRLFGDIFITQN